MRDKRARFQLRANFRRAVLALRVVRVSRVRGYFPALSSPAEIRTTTDSPDCSETVLCVEFKFVYCKILTLQKRARNFQPSYYINKIFLHLKQFERKIIFMACIFTCKSNQ